MFSKQKFGLRIKIISIKNVYSYFMYKTTSVKIVVQIFFLTFKSFKPVF